MRWRFIIAFIPAFIAQPSCVPARGAVVSVAQVVDAIAHKGDQIDAVTVDVCHKAESAAADIPDLRDAELAVMRIREACDKAFAAVDVTAEAIARVDAVMEKVETGELSVDDLAGAAIKARQAFEKAQVAHDDLREVLEQEASK